MASLFNAFETIGTEGALQKCAVFLQQIASSIGRMYPDTSGNMRVSVQNGTITTVTTVTTLSTLTTLTNQTQQSGFATSYDQYSQMMVCADAVRTKISVS